MNGYLVRSGRVFRVNALMEIEKDRQSEARQKVQALLRSAEEMRRQRRVEYGVGELMRGRLDFLYNDELAASLPEYLADLLGGDGEDTRKLLLVRIGEASISADASMRQRAIMILSLSAERIVALGRIEALAGMSALLLPWLSMETEIVAGYETVCRQLQVIGTALLQNGRLREADPVLSMLEDIRSGRLKKKNSIRSMAARSLEDIARPGLLAQLFSNLFDLRNEESPEMERILILLGRPAVRSALGLLKSLEEGDERERLVHFFISAGRSTVRVFEEQMQQQSPWHARCEMLRILAAMEDDGVYPLIEANLGFPDIRVQREAIDSLVRIGGENLIQRLTEALSLVDDSLKSDVVRKLAKLESLGIRDALLSLLDEKVGRKDFSDEQLLSSIVVGLRSYPDPRAIIQLRELRGYLEDRVGAKKLLHLIDDTLVMLESEMRHRQHRKIETESVSFTDDPESIRQAKMKTREIEKEVISFLERGMRLEAAEKLFESCVAAAREKDFATAERLRDRILGADTGSVDLVIKADEIINWERDSRIPASYYELWKSLRGAVGAGEFEHLYGALVAEQYTAGEIIFREGERADRLYLVDSGTVSLVCGAGSTETYLKRLPPGSVVGADQFFAITVWTVTAKARTAVELHSLSRSALLELEEREPGIGGKLQQYCAGFNSVPELLKMSGGDRRGNPRFSVAAIIHTILVDDYGEPGHRRYVGQLQDIAQGGFCYCVSVADKEQTRALLGKQILFELALADNTTLRIEGTVVGIEPVEGKKEMYRIHGRMLERLSPEAIRKIVEKHG